MSAESTIRNLHQDKRGAIMLIGLCMSCFLIGSLWFLIGIGDAIVFRDNMQEATDHATFTSAALHAKGMNFISALNLLILALIMIHLVLGIIQDILLLVCIASLGFGCGAFLDARDVYTTYSKIFKPVAGAMHYAEVAAAVGYPLLGAYKGYTVGGDYGGFGPKKHDVTMIVVGPSLIPGGIIDSALNKAFTRTGKGPKDKNGKPTDDKSFTGSSGKRFGLPVMPRAFGEVCVKIGKIGIDALFSLVHVDGGFLGVVKDALGGFLGGALKARYCNDLGSVTGDYGAKLTDANTKIQSANDQKTKDNANLPKGGTPKKLTDTVPIGTGSGKGSGATACLKDNSSLDPGFDSWWGCDGPMVPWDGTENGSPWNQVWGVNFRPSFSDAQEHRVNVAQRKYGAGQTAEPSTYFAEAEFYFDCTKDWSDSDECNKDDNAGYSIQWRARLKRLQFPQIGELLGSFAGQFLSGMKIYKDFQEKITNLPAKKNKEGEVITEPGKGGSPLLSGGFESTVDDLLDKYVTEPLTGALTKGGAGADKLLDPDLGAYH